MKSAIAFLLVGALVACGDDSSDPHDVVINFAAHVGDQEFACGATYTGLGTSGVSVELTDFRYYVHDVRLVDKKGQEQAVELTQDGVWQVQNVALLDFENGTGNCDGGTTELNTTVRGKVAGEDFSAVRFRVGVPAELGHANFATAPSPLNIEAMAWSWLLGYRFMRVDALVGAGGNGFPFHLGSNACTGTPETGGAVVCEKSNIPEIELTTFDVDSDAIALDYARLTEDNDLEVPADGMEGCHSGAADGDCATLFAQLGIDIATGAATLRQSAFVRE